MRKGVLLLILSLVVFAGCSTSYKIIKPIYPKAHPGGYSEVVKNLQPTFTWQPLKYRDTAYDFAIFECIKVGALHPEVGQIIYYREALSEPKHKIEELLKPGTQYFWAVRLRRGDRISPWSVYDWEYNNPFFYGKGTNQPFSFKTPNIE